MSSVTRPSTYAYIHLSDKSHMTFESKFIQSSNTSLSSFKLYYKPPFLIKIKESLLIT